MSHFGRSGPPDIRDTFSLLVLNISFRTTADDLHPLFDRYGKVVDVFIPSIGGLGTLGVSRSYGTSTLMRLRRL